MLAVARPKWDSNTQHIALPDSVGSMKKTLFALLLAALPLCAVPQSAEDKASCSNMYKTYAAHYDRFYQSKDYAKETSFLHQLLAKYQVHSILDVGCGTGTHLSNLEHCGYACEGIDLNIEMLEIAKTKVKGQVSQADMRNFNLKSRYDAIISMFAVFNHNLDVNDARRTLMCFQDHLALNGILVLDLYNPQSSGKKMNSYEGITRVMEWHLNTETQLCESLVSFTEGDKTYDEKFPLKIYPIALIKQLLTEAGFTSLQFYDNYTFDEGTSKSKNLIVAAHATGSEGSSFAKQL